MTEINNPQAVPADAATLSKLVLVTREKLANTIVALTECETLLLIERDRSGELQKELDAIKSEIAIKEKLK